MSRTRRNHFQAVLFGAALLLAALPAAAQTYNYFPGGASTNDSRTVALAGPNIETLSQDFMTFIIAVPPGETQFEFGIYDGETGKTDANGVKHWDNGTTGLRYSLFYDPLQQGSTSPANLIGSWLGNSTSNPTSNPGIWTASSASFPDNGWWDLTVQVPVPPDPVPSEAPSGANFYHLCVSYIAHTGNSLPDPCIGGAPRPVDTSPTTISNFKVRATANIAVLTFAFAYEAALRGVANQADFFLVYPTLSFPIPSDFYVTAPTTYDGNWSFNLDVETSQARIDLFGGDFDFGTDLLIGFPSNVPITPCFDLDDPDTPNTADYPPFAVDSGGNRLDDSLPEGARISGNPPDDNRFDAFRRSPCVRWTLTSPGPDGDIDTPGDNVSFANDNPSSQREWEKFTVSSEADCNSSALCDPLADNCADYCVATALPAGTWRIDVEGVDLSNLNAWRSLQPNSFCINCSALPRPYLVGDTVWADLDGDGFQDSDEPGIPGVLVELLDENGFLLGTRRTGDPSLGYGPGQWGACQARNTGGGTVVDQNGLYCFDVSVPNDDPDFPDSQTYSVRIAASNFVAGGALFDYFGGSPQATTASPTQTNTVNEGGSNVLTYDFGYRALGSIGDRVWQDQNGDGVQDAGEPGINGVTVQLFDSGGNLIGTQVTSGDGEYLFENLVPGTYTVKVVASTLPAGVAQTFDLDGLGTPNAATGSLGVNQDRSDFDFGYQPLGSIGDRVWLDLNGNGLQDTGEPGINGVTVQLLDGAGNVIATKVTAGDGNYLFDKLPASTYTVRVVASTLPPGLSQTYDLDGLASPNRATAPLAAGQNRLDFDFGYGSCGPCVGKVTTLTLAYLGSVPNALITVETKKDGTAFSGIVQPGGSFTVVGNDKQGTLGPEIQIYVNGVLNTEIHTSCSQPIGPGLIRGDFLVLAGASRNGGLLCPVPINLAGDDCGCEGKVTTLKLKYLGAIAAQVRIEGKAGVVYSAPVAPGATFTVVGNDKNGTLGPELDVFLNNVPHTSIHTSCSQPIGPGLVRGLFRVVEGASRGGTLCPLK